MKHVIKIILVLVAILPLWMTIIALAEEKTDLEILRTKINQNLMQIDDKQIQVTKIVSGSAEELAPFINGNFEIDLSGVRRFGSSTLQLTSKTSEGTLGSTAKVQVLLSQSVQVPVATRTLENGQSYSLQDFKMEWRPIANVSGEPVLSNDLLHKKVRGRVTAGSVIDATKVQNIVLVKRGERVKLSVIAKGLKISTFGIAKNQGALGETIEVLNLDSKKKIFATVNGESSAEVRL